MGEPRPLIETDAGDPLAKLVRHAADLRVEYDVAAGLVRHEQLVARLPAPATASTPGAKGWSAWSSWSLASVVAVAAVAAAIAAGPERTSSRGGPTAQVVASDRFVPPEPRSSATEPSVHAQAAQDEASEPPRPAAVELSTGDERPALLDPPSPPATPPVRARSEPRAKPAPSDRAPAAPTAPLDADDRIEREAAQIRTIRTALARRDAEAALALCDAGDDAHPDGVFAAERQGLRVLALVELGRLDDARPLAARYLAANPSGSLAPRIRRAVAPADAEP